MSMEKPKDLPMHLELYLYQCSVNQLYAAMFSGAQAALVTLVLEGFSVLNL